MKIYTKTGDKGETGLFRGARVPKFHPRVEAYGNIDELNALLGLAICEINDSRILDLLLSIQQDLFEIGTDLATPPQEREDHLFRISEAPTLRLEKAIDHFDEKLPSLQQFILPGGNHGGALLHLARTVCRRAERSVTALTQTEQVNPEVLRFLNRLSDLLFVLARTENQSSGITEVPWKKGV